MHGDNPLRILAGGRHLEEVSDEALTRALILGGALPEEMNGEAELLAMLLPALRHDCELGARYTRPQARIRCPVIVMGGLDDAAVLAASLRGWSRFTSGDVSIRMWPGGHFWFREAGAAVEEAIGRAIGSRPSSPTEVER